MADRPRFYVTTAIDYPNSRPHIGTAFEKLGADVQARYRRMEGYEVFFLMGNDENTIKVARRAAELGQDPKAYCDAMAAEFQAVWRALDISNDDFIQTSEPRHYQGCRQFIQRVYDNGYIYKDKYEGWYCEGCESFKTDTDVKEAGGVCPNHPTLTLVRRSEPCWYFALSKFQDKLLAYYEENPDFIQPESRRNEVLNFVQGEVKDINITRAGEPWGIRVPFDEQFTIYVWFDAVLNYATGVGYGTDAARFEKWWPADLHVIGKDITRFHCALWPAMCMAAGFEPPRRVFAHGFVHVNKEKMSKTLGNVVEPLDIVGRSSTDSFRYYFLRECPFPADGEYSWERYRELHNADLANNLGNLYSRVVKLMHQHFGGHLEATGDVEPGLVYADQDTESLVNELEDYLESLQYNRALQRIWERVLDPANKYVEDTKPWALAKSDKARAKQVLYDLAEQIRVAAILLKPFLPGTALTLYASFNFPQPWDEVRYEDVWVRPRQSDDLRLLAALEDGKVKPLFPRIADPAGG
jgi:methionyl-tRNA synthetase